MRCHWLAGIALTLGLPTAIAQVATPNPILFVTQFPITDDFAAIGSVFANHRGDTHLTGRGGDLHLRYGDGTLRNLTREAGFGESGVMQGANAIAVRDPHVHWSGTKAVFAMAVGAPTQQYQWITSYFQLYEVSGFGVGQTAQISKVRNQPGDTNNVMPIYASDGQIIFVSDRSRSGERHLYPQHDEYESTPTPTGLWKLDPATGALMLLQHSPSGSFDPLVDSFGRVLFTRWDHLQRDQQNESPGNGYGTFNWTSEAANAAATSDRGEVFPEPRIAIPGSGVEGFTINHFFPWQVHQDGTGEETLNHLGRHELHSYFNRSFNTDANLVEFISAVSGRVNPRDAFNFLQLSEDPNVPGRYYAVDAPEFNTQNAGQVIRFDAAPAVNPADVVIDYITHPDTEGTTPSADHSGHYRNPVVLANGMLIAAHAAAQGGAGNNGTRANPDAIYKFRLQRLGAVGNGFQAANGALTNGLSRSVQYWDPDVLVSYDGPFWELSPVEVVARPAPTAAIATTAAPELSAYTQRGVIEHSFKQFLRANGLGVLVMRDVTARDALDRQQPFNLRVPGGRQTPANPTGAVYDIAHMQLLQGDQIRGIGGIATPAPGRRVLAQFMHDATASELNGPNADGPVGSVPIASDGSVAAYVPAQRALSWQATAPDGTPVVRERFWITVQPGEVRACDGCHGVNKLGQAGQVASTQTAQAFLDLLARWRTDVGWIFADGME
ncbi:MAG TPA: hypothetical protein VN581_05495 [Patescibacteria group bacterium]|nr:hypothetical protein [Patescibacteria group bacterium]